jgi:hypothetical protein
VSESAMRRGAREANQESDAAAMGRAVGSMAAFIAVINRLTKRIEELDHRLAAVEKALRGETT